jgi:hypothetical protein
MCIPCGDSLTICIKVQTNILESRQSSSLHVLPTHRTDTFCLQQPEIYLNISLSGLKAIYGGTYLENSEAMAGNSQCGHTVKSSLTMCFPCQQKI